MLTSDQFIQAFEFIRSVELEAKTLLSGAVVAKPDTEFNAINATSKSTELTPTKLVRNKY